MSKEKHVSGPDRPTGVSAPIRHSGASRNERRKAQKKAPLRGEGGGVTGVGGWGRCGKRAQRPGGKRTRPRPGEVGSRPTGSGEAGATAGERQPPALLLAGSPVRGQDSASMGSKHFSSMHARC